MDVGSWSTFCSSRCHVRSINNSYWQRRRLLRYEVVFQAEHSGLASKEAVEQLTCLPLWSIMQFIGELFSIFVTCLLHHMGLHMGFSKLCSSCRFRYPCILLPQRFCMFLTLFMYLFIYLFWRLGRHEEDGDWCCRIGSFICLFVFSPLANLIRLVSSLDINYNKSTAWLP